MRNPKEEMAFTAKKLSSLVLPGPVKYAMKRTNSSKAKRT